MLSFLSHAWQNHKSVPLMTKFLLEHLLVIVKDLALLLTVSKDAAGHAKFHAHSFLHNSLTIIQTVCNLQKWEKN